MALADLHIEQLVLRIPGLSQGDAERLGARVRERLAQKVATAAVPTHLGRLEITLDPPSSGSLDDLADRIVSKLAARLGLED